MGPLVEADGKGLHRLRGLAGHECDNEAGIDASAEQRTEWHIGRHPDANRLLQTPVQLGCRLFARGRAHERHRWTPVPRDGAGTVGAAHQLLTGTQLANVCKRRRRTRHVLVGEITVERRIVGGAADRRIRQQCRNLRAEYEEGRRPAVVERLLAEAIPGSVQQALFRIPNGEREHSPEMAHAIAPVLLVQMDNHLRVRVGTKGVPALPQPLPDFPEVVDLTVEDDPDRPVLVGQRCDCLIAEVDNRQTSLPEADVGSDVNSLRIGTTVNERAAHPVNQLARYRAIREFDLAGNATHSAPSRPQDMRARPPAGEVRRARAPVRCRLPARPIPPM